MKHQRYKRRARVAPVRDRIERAVLRNGCQGCTAAWLEETLGISLNAVRVHLCRLHASGKAVLRGGRWVHRHGVRNEHIDTNEPFPIELLPRSYRTAGEEQQWV